MLRIKNKARTRTRTRVLSLGHLFTLVREGKIGSIPKNFLNQKTLFSPEPGSIREHFLFLVIAAAGDLDFIPRKFLTKKYLVGIKCMGRSLLVWLSLYKQLHKVPARVLTKNNCLIEIGENRETILHLISGSQLRFIPSGWKTNGILTQTDFSNSTPLHRLAEAGYLDRIPKKVLDSKTLVLPNWAGLSIIDKYYKFHKCKSRKKKISRTYLHYLLEKLSISQLETYISKGQGVGGLGGLGGFTPAENLLRLVGFVLKDKKQQWKRKVLRKVLVEDQKDLELIF